MDELVFTDGPEEVTIVKASYQLKIKVGHGGFEPEKIARAEKRLHESSHIFAEAAEPDLHLIEKTLVTIDRDEPMTPDALQSVIAGCVELKSHSIMFRHPLATTVAESLLQFCKAVKMTSPLIREVVALHVHALKIVIKKGQNPNAYDSKNLLEGLHKACEKALNY